MWGGSLEFCNTSASKYYRSGCFIEYDNNVHFEGVRFICGLHLVIIGLSKARADLMARYLKF